MKSLAILDCLHKDMGERWIISTPLSFFMSMFDVLGVGLWDD